MKRLYFFLFSSLFISGISAQLNVAHNGLRVGDVILKQQVQYKSPGRSGENVIWDFSNLKTINDEYTLSYELPPLENDSIYILGDRRYLKKNTGENELIVGTEHYTMYYYRLKNDTLQQLGHENPSVKWEYTIPLLLMKFPLNYKENTSSAYLSEGLYSASVDMQTQGSITTTADAYGKMILPSGDTLKHVLRINTIQTIHDQSNQYSGDSLNIDKGKELETCRWYSKGYRYPVFETIRNINLSDSTEIFSTAFFFPPQDHLYLDTDKENLAVLDSLWNLEHNKNVDNPITNPENGVKFSYNFYPNPVVAQLTLEYYLETPATVNITLYSMDGRLIKNLPASKQDKGFHSEYIDCNILVKGTYILRIEANGKVVSDKIIKK